MNIEKPKFENVSEQLRDNEDVSRERYNEEVDHRKEAIEEIESLESKSEELSAEEKEKLYTLEAKERTFAMRSVGVALELEDESMIEQAFMEIDKILDRYYDDVTKNELKENSKFEKSLKKNIKEYLKEKDDLMEGKNFMISGSPNEVIAKIMSQPIEQRIKEVDELITRDEERISNIHTTVDGRKLWVHKILEKWGKGEIYPVVGRSYDDNNNFESRIISKLSEYKGSKDSHHMSRGRLIEDEEGFSNAESILLSKGDYTIYHESDKIRSTSFDGDSCMQTFTKEGENTCSCYPEFKKIVALS